MSSVLTKHVIHGGEDKDPAETKATRFHAGHRNKENICVFALVAGEQNMSKSFYSRMDFEAESRRCQQHIKTLCSLVWVISNKTALDSPLISHQPLADPCATHCRISDIFKLAHHTLWHFIFPLQQGHAKVIWKDRRGGFCFFCCSDRLQEPWACCSPDGWRPQHV